MNTLYLPSTPLNLYLALADAFAQPGEHALLFLDQKQSSKYLSVLRKQQAQLPFVWLDEQIMPQGVWQKLHKRKSTFATLRAVLQTHDIERIATGSDRRVEFQFARHLCQGCTGVYLDDGLYTYMGRPWRPLKDRLDGVLKKMVYGTWWETPKTIGASSWVQEAHVFMPDKVVGNLKAKVLHPVSTDKLNSPALRRISEAMLSAYGRVDIPKKSAHLLLLTHPNNARKMPGYFEKIGMLVDKLGPGLAKYHPRVGDHDPFGMQKKGFMLLPATLALEFVLPILPQGLKVFGDVSTTLLTARWLRPDLSVTAVLDLNNPLQKQVAPLLEAEGVEIEVL